LVLVKHGKQVDWILAALLARAAAEGRELTGPASATPNNNDGRFRAEQFQIQVQQRQAICPADKPSTQCSLLSRQAIRQSDLSL
jgi:hypothetical protein